MDMQRGQTERSGILQGDKDTRLRYQGMGRNQKRYLYSEKDDKNGKKRYSYTSKKPTA